LRFYGFRLSIGLQIAGARSRNRRFWRWRTPTSKPEYRRRPQGGLRVLAHAVRSPRLLTSQIEHAKASPAYFEIIDFIAAGTTPEAVVHFRPSAEAQQMLANLIEREKENVLSPEEKAELDHFTELERILRMAKAKARQILSRGQ
jgi:hypothetical protein